MFKCHIGRYWLFIKIIISRQKYTTGTKGLALYIYSKQQALKDQSIFAVSTLGFIHDLFWSRVQNWTGYGYWD
jgi:hypothetical protein